MAKKTQEIRGHLELEIDDAALIATARFTKDPQDGEIWTLERLFALLKEKGITAGIDREELARHWGLIEKKREQTVAFPAATGIPPEQPLAESLEAEEKPIPQELEAEAKSVLEGAAGPEIVQEKSHTVKRKKTVVRKPKLPFLPEKRETVVVRETVTRPERIYVDPTVETTGYVTAEERIGVVYAQKRGVPGRNIYGDIVQPRLIADPDFYAGPGTTRKQSEIYAEQTGFLRIGANWVDVVAYAPHSWEVTASRDKATCLLTFNPGDRRSSPPSAEEVLARARELGFSDQNLLDNSEIDRMIESATGSGQPLEEAPLSQSRDASFHIYVSEDKLKAVLTVNKGIGRGKPLRLKELGAAIKASGLKKLDFAAIQKDITEFYHSSETDLVGHVLAEGKPPTAGPARDIEWSIRLLPEDRVTELKTQAEHAPEETLPAKSLAEFPMSAVTGMAFVEAEQRIAMIPPAVPGENGTDVYGATISGNAAPEPALHLHENLERKQTLVIATAAGLLDRGNVDGETHLRIRPHSDAFMEVTLSDDRMEAFLSLTDGKGTGKRLELGEVKAELERAGVTAGVDEHAVQAAVARATAGKPVTQVKVARGKKPTESSKERIKFLLQLASGSDVVIREGGRADYKNKDRVTTVDAGTRVAQLLPAEQEPEDGWDITGKSVSPRGTAKSELEIGANVRAESQGDGSTLLIAEIAGELIYDRKHIEIRPTYSVRGNVDLTTGNLRFPGSVTVTGAVTTGFYILAGGDVSVGENVEAALISSDGNIMVRQGVKGAGKAVIRAKKNIGIGFAEQATLLSVGDVVVKGACLRCSIKSNGRLVMQSDRGNVVGGSIRVRKGMEVANLGSPTGAKTTVSFGQDYLVADRIEKEEKEIENIKAQLARTDMSLAQIEKNGRREELEQLRHEKKKLMKVMEKRSLRLFTLREKYEEHFPGELRIRGTLYPQVVIESHGRHHELTEPRKGVCITFNPTSGRIEESPLDAASERKE